MILKKIVKEAKVTDNTKRLIAEIKNAEPQLKDFRDETVTDIIHIYRKENPEVKPEEIKAEDVLDLFFSPDQYFFTYADKLHTYSLEDFVEHDDKLWKAVQKVAKDYGLINDDGVDMSLHYDPNEKPRAKKPMSKLDLCVTLFDAINQDAVKNPDIDVMKADIADLSDKTVFNPELFKRVMKDVKAAYYGITEAVEDEIKTDEPAEEPVEDKEEQEVNEPQINDVPKDSEMADIGFNDMINSLIKQLWDDVSLVNSFIVTIDERYQGDNKENLKAILNDIVDDLTIDVGMSHKALDLISTKVNDLIDAGQKRAEEIIEK